ncbi:MAG: C-type lectin domain-containing protein, partial [Planctomycetota bacterium]|nr:C-type lectin domain-containing protein [Planctomycetota bacterium]
MAFGGIQGDEIAPSWNDLSAPQPGGFIVEIEIGTSDCNQNGIIDSCEPDADGDGIIDDCDDDDDNDGIDDGCDISPFGFGEQPLIQWEESSGGNGHHYQLVFLESNGEPLVLTGTEIQRLVPAGSHLATLTTGEENDFVAFTVSNDSRAWLPLVPSAPGILAAGPFIGLAGQGGCEYQWVTGEEFNYTNWHPGNPDDCDFALSQLWEFGGGRRWQDNTLGGDLGNSFILEWDDLKAVDCNGNGIADSCEIEAGDLADCNADGIPDDCESDCDANGIPDDCEEDQDGDGVPDACDDDVDGDGVPNECDIDTSTQSPYANATYWDPADGGNGHWYAFVEFEKGCLEETSAQAQALGGHLATITSQDENDFVDSLVPGAALTGVRLGGFQAPGNMDPSAGWNWVTGEPWSYTDWSTGGLPQPDDSKGDESWLRLLPTSIYGDAFGGWYDVLAIECDTGSSTDPLEPWMVEWSILDCNNNGIKDECEPDSDGDSIPDDCDDDADNDGIPDECDIDLFDQGSRALALDAIGDCISI